MIGFGDRLNTNLSAVTDPEVSTGHLLRNHARKNNSGGRQIDIAIWFEQQTVPTLIGYTEWSNIDDVFTTRVFNLSAAQADSINNYSQLIQRTFGREVGGGGPRRPWESAQEFECPDPPGGGGGFAHSQGVIVG